jgi:hypothetical protein
MDYLFRNRLIDTWEIENIGREIYQRFKLVERKAKIRNQIYQFLDVAGVRQFELQFFFDLLFVEQVGKRLAVF